MMKLRFATLITSFAGGTYGFACINELYSPECEFHPTNVLLAGSACLIHTVAAILMSGKTCQIQDADSTSSDSKDRVSTR